MLSHDSLLNRSAAIKIVLQSDNNDVSQDCMDHFFSSFSFCPLPCRCPNRVRWGCFWVQATTTTSRKNVDYISELSFVVGHGAAPPSLPSQSGRGACMKCTLPFGEYVSNLVLLRFRATESLIFSISRESEWVCVLVFVLRCFVFIAGTPISTNFGFDRLSGVWPTNRENGRWCTCGAFVPHKPHTTFRQLFHRPMSGSHTFPAQTVSKKEQTKNKNI